jgi:hypothetical protein
MAFGVKVRKVNMMRGNRQGNNAFLEDPVHEHQTPTAYLLNNEYCLEKAFTADTVKLETLQVIDKCLGEIQFKQFVDKALPVLMRHGCYKAIMGLFEIMGKQNSIVDSFFNKVFYELLTCKDKCKITDEEMRQAKRNQIFNYAHVAALNPSGRGLAYLIEKKHDFNVTVALNSTAHYAAVCNTSENLKILVDNEISLHSEGPNKRTPLLWALAAQKSHDNIKTILESLNKA